MSRKEQSSYLSRRQIVVGLSYTALFCAFTASPLLAAEWQKVKAFGVELEVPSNWKRFEYRRPPEDHDEVQFAENPRNPSAGAWFSVFPNNQELLDPDRTEQPTVIDGRAAKLTDMLTRAEDPPPRRRQIVIYFSDSNAPAFLFDGDADKWSVLGPMLNRILGSIRLPKR